MAPTNYDEGLLYDMAKGTMDFGNIKITYDFTGGLSKEQWLYERKRETFGAIFEQKNGRLTIPSMGIY